ncbi:unnamed protein product [Camellia sinensis]
MQVFGAKPDTKRSSSEILRQGARAKTPGNSKRTQTWKITVCSNDDVQVLRTVKNGVSTGCSIDDVVYYILGKRPRSEGSSDSSISFCDDDLEGVDLPYNNPLVIYLKVGDHLVNKILVDTGSSVNVMYNNLFKMLELKPEDLKPTSYMMCGFNGVPVQPIGEVTLPIYVDLVTVQILFMVVDVSSRYNAIIDLPWLHEMRAIPSTYNQLLKFHLDTGITAIRGDQRASKECCMIEVKCLICFVTSGIADGFMRSDSGPIAVFNFAKFSEEAETDAKIRGDDSSVTVVEKVGASSEHLQVNSLPGVPAPDDA